MSFPSLLISNHQTLSSGLTAMQCSDEHAYQCQSCGSVGNLRASALGNGVFVCANCGLTSDEAGTRMQEDLASLFKQNMQLSRTESIPQIVLPQEQPTTYSISQHYHHSAHLASPSEEDGYEKDIVDAGATIASQGIDVSQLSMPQIRLFTFANQDQQRQLVEIWKLSPPRRDPTVAVGDLGDTNLEREEHLARLRMEEPRTEQVVTIVPSPNGMDVEGRRPDGTYGAEPYMKSGYEVLAERDYKRQSAPSLGKDTYNPYGTAVGSRHALDPAFSGREWWRNFAGEYPPEHPYGSPRVSGRMDEDQEMS